MTNEELIDYYANLLIIQYYDKAKARAMIETVVTPVIMDQIPLDVQDAFDLDTAEGVQLDVLGKYVGVTRFGYSDGVRVELSDADYRTLMRLVVIKNNSGSSLATINALLSANFPNSIRVSDSQSMTLNYLVAETIGSPALLDIIISGGYLPKPMGVQISVTEVPSLDINYFGFRNYTTYPAGISPYNSYPFYQTTFPWLTY